MKRDDERHEFHRLRDQLHALDSDIEAARRDLELLTTAHYEEYFRGPRVPRRPEAVEGNPLRLHDGSTVVVRAVQPADSSLLKEGYAHLSALTRYRRFVFDRPDLLERTEISDSEAAELTTLDRDHEALVAIDPRTGAAAGIARYVRDAGEATGATAAVTIVDRWQGRGLGTALLKQLAQRASASGIDCFEGHMIVGDVAARRMFESVGSLETTERAAGIFDLTVRLRR